MLWYSHLRCCCKLLLLILPANTQLKQSLQQHLPQFCPAAFTHPGSAFARQQQHTNTNSTPCTPSAPRYVAWSGDECVPGTIQLSAGLAAALSLPAGAEVTLEALPRLAAAAAVVVEPVSAADWEVVELNAGLLEDMLLSQVGCS
jgi:hypothetical protein